MFDRWQTDNQTKGINKRCAKPPIVMKLAVMQCRLSLQSTLQVLLVPPCLGTDLDLSRHWESPSRVYRTPQYTVTVRTSPMPPTRTHIFCSPSLLLQTRTPFGYTGDIFVIKGPSFSTSSASFVPISSLPLPFTQYLSLTPHFSGR